MEILSVPYAFQYCLNPESDEPTMSINGQIGAEPLNGQGVNGFIFSNELMMLDNMGKSKINIVINSDGGDVKSGYTIFTTILRCKSVICGYIGGFALSIAGVIFQACKERIMYPFSTLMVHNPAIKGTDTTVEESSFLEWIKETLIVMLTASTKLSKKSVNQLMSEETWMNAQSAVQKGFADTVAPMKEEVEEIDLEYIKNNKMEIHNYVEKYSLVLNQVIEDINKNNNLTMIEKLKRVLNLADSATEEEVMNASKTVFPFMFVNTMEEDCAMNAEVLPTKLVNDDADMEEEIEDMKSLKAENLKLKNELSNLRNQKVIDLIDNSIKVGKIKSAESKHWIDLAKANYSATETILNSLSVNKISPSLTDTIDKEKTAELISKTINEVEIKVEEATKEVVNQNSSLDYTPKYNFNELFKKIK